MESEIEQTHINSIFFDRQKFQRQFDIIKHASEVAQQKIDYQSAHDDKTIRAIEVVEDFLRKKHRLCYGGQAINAHLPSKYKFYDPEYSIPDYDFFTPNQYDDINILVKQLKKAGFTEISAREGMHEGTVKIYVDYVAVADMTAIDPKLYKILSKREYKINGISYLDANTLRMLMYLELSRPRGEVGRWPKVFERLALFNEFVPVVKVCHDNKQFINRLSDSQIHSIVEYITHNKRIFAGADLLEFYTDAFKTGKQHAKWIVNSRKPIIFFSPSASIDAKQIREELTVLSKNKTKGGSEEQGQENNLQQSEPITIKSYSSQGLDLIPSFKVISQGNKMLVVIIEQSACHSYMNIPLSDNKLLRVASLDTLITLYFSLGLIDNKFFDMGSMECLANKLVQLSIKCRDNPDKFPFPFISIKCAGHQTSLSSLIRAKVKRITMKKQQIKRAMTSKNRKKELKDQRA